MATKKSESVKKNNTSPESKVTTESATESIIEKVKPKKRLTLKDIPPLTLVEVRSNFYGTLVYVSRKTGYEIVWNEFGTSQYMTVEELSTMRNTQINFFKNNWIVLEGENAQDILEMLQVDRFYVNAIDIDNFDEIFSMSPDEITETISKLPDGTKESIARRAFELIESKKLDSMKCIEALEKALNVELIDR